jgi:nucleoid-associated protein YgaU
MNSRTKSNSFLNNIIKILIILLLLALLFISALFIKGFFLKNNSINSLQDQKQKENIVTKPIQKEQILSQTVTSDKKVETNKHDTNKTAKEDKKLYTEEEMQEIIQMMIDQIDELQSEVKVSNESSKVTTNQKLENSLKELSADTTQEKETLAHKEIKKLDNIKAQSDDANIDHYNKVVIQNSKYSDAQIDQISKQIGSIVDDITQNRVSSTYTQKIKKEVNVREDAMRIVVVKRGDTLSKIALRAYGSVKGYKKIFEANKELIKNPNHIYVGQKLRVPTL